MPRKASGRWSADVRDMEQMKKRPTNIIPAHNPAKLPSGYTRPIRPGGAPPVLGLDEAASADEGLAIDATLSGPYPRHSPARHRCAAQRASLILALPMLVLVVVSPRPSRSRSSSGSTVSARCAEADGEVGVVVVMVEVPLVEVR
jgi:hypothetical protein